MSEQYDWDAHERAASESMRRQTAELRAELAKPNRSTETRGLTMSHRPPTRHDIESSVTTVYRREMWAVEFDGRLIGEDDYPHPVRLWADRLGAHSHARSCYGTAVKVVVFVEKKHEASE